MAPKRKRPVSERPPSNASSFTDCPACQMKVVSYLINHHLDWDCPALIRNKEQLPSALAAKITGKCAESPEGLLCNRELRYDGPDIEDFEATDTKLFVFGTDAKLQNSPIQDSVAGLHDRVHATKAQAELNLCSDNDKLDAVVANVSNNVHSDPDFHSQHIYRSDAGFQGGPSIREKDSHDWHGAGSDANEQCLEIHNGSLKPKDQLNSNAHNLLLEERGQSSAEASTSSPKSAKGDGWRLITASLPSKAPKGHYVFENFISEKEEQDILCFLDTDLKNPWRSRTFNGSHIGKSYGLSTDLRKRCVRPAVFEMPKVLVPVLERMRTTVPVLKDFWPNETNAIDYYKHKGHWLKPHVDDRQLSGTILVNLSLCGDCRMTYERERGPRESYKVLLRRRCIQSQHDVSAVFGCLTCSSELSCCHANHRQLACQCQPPCESQTISLSSN